MQEEPKKKKNNTAVFAILGAALVLVIVLIVVIAINTINVGVNGTKEAASAASSKASSMKQSAEDQAKTAESSAATAAQQQAVQAAKPVVDDFLTQFYQDYSGLQASSDLTSYFDNGPSTPGYTLVANHFTEIANHEGGDFTDFRWKYNGDAQLSPVSFGDGQMVIQVEYSYVGYWWMKDASTDGYQSYHPTAEIVIYTNSNNVNVDNDLVRFKTYDGSPQMDKEIYVPNMSYSQAN